MHGCFFFGCFFCFFAFFFFIKTLQKITNRIKARCLLLWLLFLWNVLASSMKTFLDPVTRILQALAPLLCAEAHLLQYLVEYEMKVIKKKRRSKKKPNMYIRRKDDALWVSRDNSGVMDNNTAGLCVSECE